jgi:hypothetical protein
MKEIIINHLKKQCSAVGTGAHSLFTSTASSHQGSHYMPSTPIKPQYILQNSLQHVRNNKNQENGSNELIGRAESESTMVLTEHQEMDNGCTAF